MAEVVYRTINNFPDYMIGTDGSVMSKRKNGTWKKIGGSTKQNGYKGIELHNGITTKQELIHRLVAIAFIPNPNGYPIVNHRDENKSNNCVENLEWCTYKYNVNYGNCQKKKAQNINYHSERQIAVKKRLQKLNSKPVVQFTKEGTPVALFKSTMDAQRNTGVNNAHISACCRGKRQSAGGYVWKYEGREEYV